MPIRDLPVLRIYEESETTGSLWSRKVVTQPVGSLYPKPESTSPTGDLASARRKWHRASSVALLHSRLAYVERLKRQFCPFAFDQATEQQIKNDLKTLGFEGFRFLLADQAQAVAMETLFMARRGGEVGSSAAAKLQAQRTIVDRLRGIAPRCLASSAASAVPADARLIPPAADVGTHEDFYNYLLFLSLESFLDSLRIGLISADKLFREVSGTWGAVSLVSSVGGSGVIAHEFEKLEALDQSAIDRILYLLIYKIKNADLFAQVVRFLIQTFYVLLFDEDFKFSAGFNNEGLVANFIKSGFNTRLLRYPPVFEVLRDILNALGSNVDYEYPTEEGLHNWNEHNGVVRRIRDLLAVIQPPTASLTVTHVSDFIIKTFLQIFVSTYLRGPNLLRGSEEQKKSFCYQSQLKIFFTAIHQAPDLSSIMPRVPSGYPGTNFVELARDLAVRDFELVWDDAPPPAVAAAPAGQRLRSAQAKLLFVSAAHFRKHPDNPTLREDIYTLHRAPRYFVKKLKFAKDFLNQQLLLIVPMIEQLKIGQTMLRSDLLKALDANFYKLGVSEVLLGTNSRFIESLEPYLNFSIFYCSTEPTGRVDFTEIETLYQRFKRLFVSVYAIIERPHSRSAHGKDLSENEGGLLRSILSIFNPSNVKEFQQSLEEIENKSFSQLIREPSSEGSPSYASGFGVAAAVGAPPPGTEPWRLSAVARAVASPASPLSPQSQAPAPAGPPPAGPPPAGPSLAELQVHDHSATQQQGIATQQERSMNQFIKMSVRLIGNLYKKACEVTPPLSEREKLIHIIRTLSAMDDMSPDKIKEMSKYYILSQKLEANKEREVILYVASLVDQHFAELSVQPLQPPSPVVQAQPQPFPTQIPANPPNFPSSILPVWLSDSQVKRCCNALCRHREAVNRQNPVPGHPRVDRPKEFSTFRRRHHCRGCGAIFCGDCTVEMWVNPVERDINGTERPLFLFSKDMQQTSFTKTLRNPMGVGGRVKVENGRTTTLCLQCARNIRFYECTNPTTPAAKNLKKQRDMMSTGGPYLEFEKKTDEHKERNPNGGPEIPFAYALSPD